MSDRATDVSSCARDPDATGLHRGSATAAEVDFGLAAFIIKISARTCNIGPVLDGFAVKPCVSGHRPDATSFTKAIFSGHGLSRNEVRFFIYAAPAVKATSSEIISPPDGPPVKFPA